MIYKDCKFTEIVDDNIKEEYKPFQRYDRKLWNINEIYIGAIFLLPIRVLLLVSSITLLCIVAKINGATGKQQYTANQQKWAILGQNIVARLIMYSVGFFWINKKNDKIKNYEESYPEEKYKNKDQKYPIIVCNHQSWTDIFAISSFFNTGFLSKSDVAKYPLFGQCAQFIQCLFVDRESESNKGSIVEQINNRCDDILKGQRYNPINIFPEGTTSNGKYLISFKKGAFEPGKPMKIVTIKYLNKNFNPALDVLPLLPQYIIISCLFFNRIEITEFDTYYPDHLGIKDYDKDWKIYGDAIKNIMVKQLKCQSSEAGYRDIKEYEKELKVLKQQLKEESKKQKQQ